MATADFRALLAKPADSVEKPQPLPAGTFYGVIKSRAFEESSEKKTPFVRFIIGSLRAGEDIDIAMLVKKDGSPIDLSKKELRADYYITPEAEYRLVEMLEKLNISKNGRSLGEMIEDAINQQVMISVSVRPNTKEPDHPGFNQIDSMTAVPG